MNDKKYFSTGEAARMLGVSKQTLIYYDQIGLLSPAHREKETYRCYTLQQADELDAILTLRSLGVPIKRLKTYLQQKSPEKFIELLDEQDAYLDREIRRLSGIQEKIRSRSKLLALAVKVENLREVRYFSRPREYYIAEPCHSSDENECLKCFLALCIHAKEWSLDFASPVCRVIGKEDVLRGNYAQTSHYAIRTSGEECFRHGGYEIPEGLFAATYCRGGENEVREAFQRLLQKVRADGREIGGDGYLMDLLSTLTNTAPEDYMAMAFVRIENDK